jgi:hypothetical protein
MFALFTFFSHGLPMFLTRGFVKTAKNCADYHGWEKPVLKKPAWWVCWVL